MKLTKKRAPLKDAHQPKQPNLDLLYAFFSGACFSSNSGQASGLAPACLTDVSETREGKVCSKESSVRLWPPRSAPVRDAGRSKCGLRRLGAAIIPGVSSLRTNRCCTSSLVTMNHVSGGE